jgi:hypothetical protein
MLKLYSRSRIWRNVFFVIEIMYPTKREHKTKHNIPPIMIVGIEAQHANSVNVL